MNCKQGDIAFIRNEPGFPENDGKLVEILGPSDGHFYGPEVRGDWTCKTLSHGVTGWANDELTKKEVNAAGELVCINDKYLHPIRPGETPEESTDAMHDLTSIPTEVTA